MTSKEAPDLFAVDLTAFDRGAPSSYANLEVKFNLISPQDRLNEFRKQHAVAESITDALTFETAACYKTGLPQLDEGYIGEVHAGRVQLMDRFSTMWRQGVVDGAFTIEGTNRQPLGSPEIMSELHQRTAAGLAACEGAQSMVLNLQILYSRESPAVWHDEALAHFAEAIAEQTPDMELLFGEKPPENSTFHDIAEALHKRYQPDTSQETLEQRFNTFTGVLNLDLSLAILRCMSFYASFGNNKGRQAVKLARSYQELLLSDNIPAKQAVLNMVSELCQKATPPSSRNSANAYERQAYITVSMYADSLIADTNRFLDFFSNVYTSLGHALPPLLRPKTEPLPDSSNPAVATEVVPEPEVVALPEPGPAPELVAEIRALTRTLDERAEEAVRPWRLSKRQIKTLGAEALMAVLKGGTQLEPDIQGFELEGDWTLAPLPHDYAASLLGAIIHLTGKDGTEVTAELEAAAVDQQEIVDSAAVAQAYAELQGCGDYISIRHPVDMAERLQSMADNWHIFRRLFSEVAPTKCEADFTGLAWQVLPEPRPTSTYMRLLREYQHRYDLS
jgi:hypothetical protein